MHVSPKIWKPLIQEVQTLISRASQDPLQISKHFTGVPSSFKLYPSAGRKQTPSELHYRQLSGQIC